MYGQCLSSLEDRSGKFKLNRLFRLRDGQLYAVPKKDSNFSLWTGVYYDTRVVDKSNIKDIGQKNVRRRHLFGIGKK